jgi:uncharacterized membrane protein
VRHFSFRPSLTMSGRENRGLRGLAGKPLHPPLTDIPIAAYMFAAVFDILSFAVSSDSHPEVTRQLFLAGTWTLLGGVIVALGAALTGWADWHRSSEPGTQARRTINAHAIIMLAATTVALIDLLVRLTASADRTDASFVLLVLSVIAAALVAVGATYGGGLVFDYGFNVETAGDHPVWHVTEVDVFPGQHADAETDAVES